MQSSHPAYITSREPVLDPETGDVLYDREQPIPWADAVKYGLVAGDERSKTSGRNTARKPAANRAAKSGPNREA